MRLFSLAGAAAVDDPEFGHFEPVDDGGFDFPGPLSERMHATAVRGQKQWENAIERQRRLITEEAARRADPATLLEAVEKLVQAAAATPPPEPAAKGRAKTASKS
jgi:hypothetical protein